MNRGRPRIYAPEEAAARHLANMRRWRQDNLERRREYDRTVRRSLPSWKASQAAYVQRLKLAALTRYGGDPPTCACCGIGEIVFLTIDHIDQNGAEHRRQVGTQTYRVLKREGYPPGYRVLCFNCNIATYRLGICPHQEANRDDNS